jgi:CMP-N,N'-diacetyllegionaminic acid synthase
MKKVAMIPARLGSKRVPKKNLRLIDGKPLIAYIIEAAKASGAFDEIYLNSEAEIFAEIASEYGIKFYHRDATFSSDKSVNDEFALDFMKNVEADIVFQLLPTSPLVTGEEIRAFVDGMVEGGYDTYVSVIRHQIACLHEETPINFSRTEKHRSSQEMKPVFSYGTVFMGWNTDEFKANIQKIGSGYHGGEGKVGYFEVSGLATIDIDEEDDFQLAEVAIKARAGAGGSVPEYYESLADEASEVDVPTILRRDGVVVSDFEHENLPVTDVDKVIEEMDPSVSWCRRIINTESNSATVISQLPGEGNRLHYHPQWNEWWYILRGKWKWNIGDEEREILPGQLVFMPKNVWHKITAIGDEPAVRLAVSRGDVAHIYHSEDSSDQGRL